MEMDSKLARIGTWLEEHDYEAMVIGRRDNFAWLTGGRESGVVQSSEVGFVYLVITGERRYAIARRADIRRTMEELLDGMDFIPVEVVWDEEGMEDAVLRILDGRKAASDIALPAAHVVCETDRIYRLHYPMTDGEIKLYEALAKECAGVLWRTAGQVQRGMTENELKRIFLCECAACDIEVDVMLIGSDQRITSYRHCMPTDKAIDQVVLLSPSLRKYGLHVNLARMVCLGAVSEDVRKRYDDVCRIQAGIIGQSRIGLPFADLFDWQEKCYREMGYEGEWKTHMHGAPTGYMVSDGQVLFEPDLVMQDNQAYEWYVTVTGAKSAELVALVNGEMKMLSLDENWPQKEYAAADGRRVMLPDIYEMPGSPAGPAIE